jgi:hypothetical protein
MKELIVEEVPSNGWWRIGAIAASPKGSMTSGTKCTGASTDSLKSGKYILKLTLPLSKGLFSASGREFLSSREV